MNEDQTADSHLDYAALREVPVNPDPFPHLTIPHFVPLPYLQRVAAGLPALKSGGSYPVAALRLGADAKALMRSLQGSVLRAAIAARFGLNLDHAPSMVTLRGRCRAKDGKIHCDSTAKRVTVLLYLSPDADSWRRQAGCLRLLRGSDDLDDYAEEIPPSNGTLLIFPNAPTAWHGHKPFVGERIVVQLNYMANDAKARHEMRRHHLSALVKRFWPGF